MADSNIGALPLAPNVADDSLLVMEQQGAAMKLTGQMLKTYAKQGVELEFQEYLDEAKRAAESAAGAVSAVTEMTVEAHDSDTPTVTKSTRAGRVNLDFGLPRGPQGIPGPTGATGPRGPQGAPGNGLTILGHYDTEAELRAAVTAPEVGDSYGVGTALPYDTYVFDGVTLDWKNYGPLSGGSSVIPENVVTSEGGAVIEMEGLFGGAPHTITITEEEIPPLTAEDIVYGGESVKEALDGLFTSVSDGKALVASAVTDKGVSTAPDASFSQIAENIGQIQTGGDTSDATATPGDILAPKTAYTKSGKVDGIIPSLPAQTIIPGTAVQTIANGQYLAGAQTIQGDPNLVSSNIRKGVSIFGVPGAVESSFAAVLTVTADIGAVVTATCDDTSVEALSTTGTVVMELPIEGTWKVTAIRGVAQYNTVTLEVSNHYNAELTAALHVQRLMTGVPLSTVRSGWPAAAIGDYAIIFWRTNCDVYSKNLIHDSEVMGAGSTSAKYYAAAATENYAIFAGVTPFGDSYMPEITAYDKTLARTQKYVSTVLRTEFAGASVGVYAVFGGGNSGGYYEDVDAFDGELVHTTATPLAAKVGYPTAAANENYAVFAGSDEVATAYNKSLTRSIVPGLSVKRHANAQMAAARAGNYILFAGGYPYYESTTDSVDAYDLFLTRTTIEALSVGRYALSATTLNDFAVFAGGREAIEGSISGVTPSNAVDVYDPYLVRTTPDPLYAHRYSPSAVSVGPYALIAGGTQTGNAVVSIVEVYQYT